MIMHSLASPSDSCHARTFCIALIIILSAAITVRGEVISVCDKGCEYNRIILGVDHANPGDTVEVRSGIYKENVVIATPIILKGVDSGRGIPELDADHNGSGFTIAADGVLIEGFKVRNARGRFFDLWAGINVVSNDNIIINNVVSNNRAGILVKKSCNNTVIDNIVSNNMYGIRVDGGIKNNVSLNNACNNEFDGIMVDGSQKNSIKNNYLCGNHFGLHVVASIDNLIFNNEIMKNRYGIFLNSSSRNTLRNNRMNSNNCSFDAARDNNIDTSNLVDAKPIYFLMHASDMILDSTSNAGLVYCFDCRNVTIEDLILENNLYGIYFNNTIQSCVKDNAIKDNFYGIKFDTCEENIIANNSISSSLKDGISLNASKNNYIESNLLSENEGSGLDMVYSIGNSITDNIATSNYNGLMLSWSHDNRISANKLSLNRNFGVSLINSGYNDISSNSLSENLVGAALGSSWNNDITDNRINRNEKSLQIRASHNNNISNNNIFENSVVLSRDFSYSWDHIIENKISNNEKKEEIITPLPTKRTPGLILPKFTDIQISSNPENAEIVIDTDPKGKTNQTIKILEGEHKLELSWRNSTYPYRVAFDTKSKNKIFVDRQKLESE